MRLKINSMVKLLLIGLLASSLSACVTSPTGRNQLILFTNNQLAATGQQAFTAMKAEMTIESTENVNSYVRCIAGAITNVLGNKYPKTQWEVVVFDDEKVNAFALPGGKIGVYTGLLAVAENQHQLAAVECVHRFER